MSLCFLTHLLRLRRSGIILFYLQYIFFCGSLASVMSYSNIEENKSTSVEVILWCLYRSACLLVSQLVAKFALFFENSDSFGKPGYGLARERDRRTVAVRFVINTPLDSG
jgi:hypothetical protein